MTSTDTDFTRAFASRVRQQLETHRRTALEGGHAVSTKTDAQTVNAPVPATFQAAPDAPCEAHAWCVKTGQHEDCSGAEIGLPSPEGHGLKLLTGHLFHDDEDGETGIVYDRGGDNWTRLDKGDDLRAETAKVRSHLARLDALADQIDAITEALTGQPAEEPEPITSVRFVSVALTETHYGFKRYGNELRVAWDPSRVTYNTVRGAILAEHGSRLLDLMPKVPPVWDAPVTAADRDPEWTARFGCTPICRMDHDGEDGTPGWHKGVKADVVSPQQLSIQLPTEAPEELLSSRVVTSNDNPDVFGVATKLWVYAGGDVVELDLDGTDRLIVALENYLPALRAQRAQLAETVKGDRPADPEASARYRAEVDTQQVDWIARELGAEIVEADPVDGSFTGYYLPDPKRLVFPAGQSPADRAAAARSIYKNRGAL